MDGGLVVLLGSGPVVRARALFARASVVWRSSRNAQGLEAQLAEAVALARASGEPDLQASVLALQASIRNNAHKDHAGGEALHAQALALWEASGNSHAAIGGRYNLAICDYNARRYAQALVRLQSVTAQTRDEEDWQQLSAALNVQGNTLCGLRRWAEALDSFRECVRVAFDCNEFHSLAYGLWNMPVALARLRRPADAARLAAFSAAFWESRFGPLSAGDGRELRRNRRLAAVQLGPAATANEWRIGQALSLAEAMALAEGSSPASATTSRAAAQVIKA